MMPYIGADYDSSSHRKLLIVGESYYFPDESTIHHDAQAWYELTQGDLNEEEIWYIHCRGLVECDWSSAGHKMYRELNSCLGTLGLPGPERAISHVSFMNTFFRPASVPGESFRHCCQSIDIEESMSVLPRIFQMLAPDVILFCSKFSWDSVGRSLELDPSVNLHFVSHPTDPFHWNVESYEHGRNKFMEILQDEFIYPDASESKFVSQ